MGKYSGRVLTMFITPSGVRVCEGENKSGDPDISKFFVVRGVESYFSDTTTSHAPDIINMAGLVSAIVEECKNRNTTTRRVLVCSDCFGITTERSTSGGGGGGLKSALTGDVKEIFSSLKRPKEKIPPDKMVCDVNWGMLTLEGKTEKCVTRSIGDKYMLQSLVQQFYEAGYSVTFISGAQEALMNFKHTEPATFDSQGKIIFNLDSEFQYTVFFKDNPVDFVSLSRVDESEILERIQSAINANIGVTGRNPRLYLCGSMFEDVNFYNQICADLEERGYLVCDLFGRPPVPADYIDQVMQGSIEPVFSPDFAANVAMLMNSHLKELITLTPNLEFGEMFKKNSKLTSTLVLGSAILLFSVSAGLGGLRFYQLQQMKKNPSALSSLQSQVSTLTTRQQSLNSTISTLTQADLTILQLMQFIDTNQSDRVSVISVDTRDMISSELTVDVSETTLTPDMVGGSAGGGTPVREAIVIRGYAKTGNEAVGYYDRLFRAGLSSDPVLNGVERYTLPNGEEVYVFEIEIGGEF